ncbi:MAG TPA: hypothetical protein VEX18_09915, partial [Polyangiaceae bacterium]|nr:hypothetical protein [Polyangiaceae bacterium]
MKHACLLLFAAVALGGCAKDRSADDCAPAERVVDPVLLAFLSQARSAHHVADQREAMGDTAAAVDERFGEGRVVAFNFDPNFRAFTDGTQRMLRNAMFGDDPGTARAAARASAAARSKAR